ncbi:MAG: LysE family translocator [Pseudomonadota bacterium]
MDFNMWLLYMAAVFVLTVTPGPSVLLCITNGIHFGARRTFASALGSISAVCIIMLVSAAGLGAVLAASEKIFLAIKWLGAAYLVYIGIKTFFSKQSSISVDRSAVADRSAGPSKSLTSLYLQGFMVGASNPKALLFFSAFFPQFLNPDLPQLSQFMILGGTFVCFECFWLMFYANFAARVAPWLQTAGRARMFNRVSGLTFVGAGALLASVRRN